MAAPIHARAGDVSALATRLAHRLGPVAVLGLTMAWLGCGCTQPPEVQAFTMDVQAQSDPGKPLAGARVLHGSRELGRTEGEGAVRVTLPGRAGEVVSLQVACPDGHSSPGEPLSVVLRPLVDPAQVPQYRVLCPPLLRSLVVAVRARNGPGLPLVYMDREIARTDSHGAAHALLKVAPEAHVTLMLDTSGEAHRTLRPKNPEFTLIMPPRDTVELFEETFTREKPKRKKRRRRQRPGPIKIEGPRR